MVISFSKLGQHGRLGNQLFQVAGTLGLAEKNNAKAVFPAWRYEKYFDNILVHGDEQPVRIEERYFHHHEWDLKDNVDLLGYLQSEKYFAKDPKNRLRLNPVFVDQCKKELDIFSNETICIQIRRGDYVGNPNYFQLTPEFYIDSLTTHFPNWRGMNILIISDDIEWCKVHFECLPNVYFSNNMYDIQDMALGSCCDHFIISNSTFGWWTAWFGEKPHSKIVHSGHLFEGRLGKTNTKDYRPERWVEHRKESYKIDLTDLTFTIPVQFDHGNRKENLELILCMLQQSFDSHYIIGEQGGSHFEYTKQWVKYQKFDWKHFHRTKMLNDMAGQAVTPFIANWDCDVLVPPAQLWLAVEALRAGADMVYPYDGRFGRLPRPQWFEQIQKALDIGVVKGAKLRGMEPDHNSVGGAVLWNKDSFIDGGMENENFISFGPEDCERHDRFKVLGYSIKRTGGALFHINHYVGPDSSPENPFFQHNNHEIDKIRQMSKQELLSYVDTWTWRHPYTSSYYHRISESAIKSAKEVMKALPFKPKTVIDVGCGVGEWYMGYKREEYIGIDYHVKKEDLLIPDRMFIECDMNKEFPDIGYGHTDFDLCLCLEVAEHLKPNRAEPLVEFLCSLSDRILFSAAIPHQGGVGHVNEQWQTYWADLFEKHGFRAAKKQPNIRHNPNIDLWYRQNIILYEKDGKGKVENYVLPEYYIQIVKGIKAV